MRGILFDIGDTLIPASAIQGATLEATVAELHARDAATWPSSFAAAYADCDRDPRFDATPDLNHLFSDARIVAAALDAVGAVPDQTAVDLFLQTYRARLRERLRPDAALRRVLEALRDHGLRLGIVSNGTTREQHEQLQRVGIGDLFAPVIISEEVGIRKPDTRLFDLAARDWKLAPEHVMMVGDRIDWDVAGAKAAGMRAALTLQYADDRGRAATGVQPDFVIERISDLPELLGVDHAADV